MTASLPVPLYHYISRSAGAINVFPENFEAHCQGMATAGYRGVSLERAAEYLLHGAALPKKSVLITFDDGFLDNLVHGLPSLERHGHAATVFAVAQRLEQATQTHSDSVDSVDAPFVRNTLGERERRDLFMTWEQARQAEGSGVMTIAAHSLTHAPAWGAPDMQRLRQSPGDLELLRPGARNRTFDRPAPFAWGLPRLPELPGLANRGFLISEELLGVVRQHVPQEEDGREGDLRPVAAFFEDAGAVAALRQALLALPDQAWGRLETEEEYRQRVYEDLRACRELLEARLGSGADTDLSRRCLAWPWGKYSPTGLEMAREAGFRVFFATSFGANLPGARPEHVHRFKARDKSAAWLRSRLWIYSRPWAARLYAGARL